MSIHKIVGAARNDIFALLSREFRMIFAMTLALALPLGYYLAGDILQEFAIKTKLSALVFLIPSGMVVGAAVLIVIGHALHHAAVNPVKFLRYE